MSSGLSKLGPCADITISLISVRWCKGLHGAPQSEDVWLVDEETLNKNMNDSGAADVIGYGSNSAIGDILGGINYGQASC